MSAAVTGNDWSVFVPPADATWVARRRVSVCIPCRNPSSNIERTLDALELQTYPTELMEVLIADDGSDLPFQPRPDRPFPVDVVRLERTLEFGAGRARNAAAAAATGDVLVFLDADIVPERQVVASYLRWFEARMDVFPMGLCRFADLSDLGDDEFRQLVVTGGLAEHFEGREVDDQLWRENTFRRTNDLRIEAVDAFRITIGATFAVSAQQYHEVGGFRELGLRGIEDTEFGYRMHANGAVFILDRDAQHWHQGRRNLNADRRRQIHEERRPYVERLLPIRGFRDGAPKPLDEPVPTVPEAIVHVAPGQDEVARLETVRRHLPDDSMAVLGDDDPTDEAVPFVPSFCHIWLSAGVELNSDTVPLLVDELQRRRVGAVVAGTHPDRRATAVTTRALRRVRREVGSVADLVDEVGRRFGRWHLPASGVGLTFADDASDG